MKPEQQRQRLSFSGLAAALLLRVTPQQAVAMHIMVGLLPLAGWPRFLYTVPADVMTSVVTPSALGLARYKREEKFFRRMRYNAIKEAR
ncbi:hypothetical protein ACS33_12490 [Edwardsiella ictaluri]|uniref:Uncharacterized protein n=1 Tax=Edwardsiella ictaluri (strain 93-146) TaxID=634503 RepID=C5BFS9_EDWI9|nr:hypothetical protein NT01EI_2181 [Edwardsiella ictaluri 93-146]KMQ77781.1 hypothetical protein ABY58_12620 [Edwardsiella ictaluri]KOO54653.1 hypothetical protein ACS33_12490 [Edwardsiella ictaluri]STP81064.1 Energy-coupling factor transporter probable substrate-capture protein CbiM [Edwardsiella ictaluri]BEH99221.1 hypothetical protein KH20906_19490 [Edwardsiella ictaluri]